ncbi:class I SAM-dependent methyltransferase [Mycolicibacterium litorale]|uniref:S-adenosyl-L-methionine-dependent methyltransferase n=1 Tax=Mycolicibacterium litorale TaxID=758802 RepID=A0AAD1ILQ2_9MYCO|nr:class I SAM-dependent methyltransferase [Mycolicibacterium litorale]MCV7416969.1 class I SAM-dependent methyltransferase [Mycolicibacterium litorale]TDY04754.1 methyltransferase (TIGR00027 family) [Mycolicibacterium litorale]BBY18182.1 putative S-adenosyl-L-methionine-dependent methyltransferase [Mycolicibacterium litorale]
MRHDNDSWDITTSVGSTALFVAASRALEARKPEPLAVDPYAEVFCRAVVGEWADLFDGAGLDSKPDHILHTAFGVQFVNFQGARTRYFDAYFAAAAAAGVRQIVLLAAGLDSRAYRLPWPDGTVVYELDQPQVLDFKRRVLADHGDEPRAQRRAIAVDLRDDWQGALTASGFDPGLPSAWLAEGLLMYLPAVAQQALFAGIDALSAPNSWAAVEESVPMPTEVFEAKRAEERAAGDDGTFFTLVYNERHAPAEQWFSERGWAAEPTSLADYLADVGRPMPAEDPEVGAMISAIRLITATKG